MVIDDTMVVDVITYNVMRLIELPVVAAEAVDGAKCIASLLWFQLNV